MFKKIACILLLLALFPAITSSQQFHERIKLTADDAEAGDTFGEGVAIDR